MGGGGGGGTWVRGYFSLRCKLHHKTTSHVYHDDDDQFRFNDASIHEGHLRQNGKLTWFSYVPKCLL